MKITYTENMQQLINAVNTHCINDSEYTAFLNSCDDDIILSFNEYDKITTKNLFDESYYLFNIVSFFASDDDLACTVTVYTVTNENTLYKIICVFNDNKINVFLKTVKNTVKKMHNGWLKSINDYHVLFDSTPTGDDYLYNAPLTDEFFDENLSNIERAVINAYDDETYKKLYFSQLEQIDYMRFVVKTNIEKPCEWFNCGVNDLSFTGNYNIVDCNTNYYIKCNKQMVHHKVFENVDIIINDCIMMCENKALYHLIIVATKNSYNENIFDYQIVGKNIEK